MSANGHAILERPRVVWFQSGDIPGLWQVIEPFIDRALLPGSAYTVDDVHSELMTGHMQLWAYGEFDFDCMLVTKCEEDCLLLALSGNNMGDWLQYLRLVESWARQCGARRMLIHGRKGWQRVLKGYNADGQDDRGWHILTKDL